MNSKSTTINAPQASFSRRHKKVILYSVGIVAALFAVLSPTLFYRLPTATLEVSGQKLTLEIASTTLEQQKGLGGRASLARDHGMLFTFDQPSKICFWMKDTRFPLDMIWLNSAKQVTDIQQNISPKTYPKSFCPSAPEKYVIELSAGEVQKLHIHTGQTLKFS